MDSDVLRMITTFNTTDISLAEEIKVCHLIQIPKDKCPTSANLYTFVKNILSLVNPNDQVQGYEEDRITAVILTYINPVIFFMGILGNIASILVLSRRSMRKVSVYVYLTGLAVADLVSLVLGPLFSWLAALPGTADPLTRSRLCCGILTSLTYIATNASSWTLVAVTVDRVVAVRWPLHARRLCSPGRARLTLAILWATALVVNVHFVFTTTILQGQCDVGPKFHYVGSVVWPYVDALLYSLLPFTGLLCMNTVIIMTLRRADRSRRTAFHLASVRLPCPPVQEQRVLLGAQAAEQTTVVPARRQDAVRNNRRLNLVLMTLSFTFALLTLPRTVTTITALTWKKTTSPDLIARYSLIREITGSLMYLNHSINFFLYCATGSRFRKELIKQFCRCKHNRLYRMRGRPIYRPYSTGQATV